MARPKGATNKNKDRLWKALQAEYGEEFDPIMRMAEIAHRNSQEDSRDDQLALTAWKEVAQYVYPKLKAVEISSDPENPIFNGIKVEFVRADNEDS